MPHESLTKTLYTTTASAQGGRGGRVRSEDGVIDVELGKPGSATNPKANPETLFAAGYASCFNNALGRIATSQGLDGAGVVTEAAVSLGATGDTGVGLAVELVSTVPGADAATAQQLAEAAHEVCPYSKATRGNIDVTVVGRPA
ncbi:MAG: Ohr family peroxiredoxin [Ornithinibacter sp.]